MPSPGGRRRRPARSGRPRLRRDHPTTLRLQADEDLFRRGGPTEVVALPDLAAQLAERHCRLLVLDALGDDARPRSARRRRGHRGRGDGSGAPRAGLRDRAGLPPRSAHHAGTDPHAPADAGPLDDPVAGAVFLTVLVVAACLLAMASPVIAGRWPAALLLH